MLQTTRVSIETTFSGENFIGSLLSDAGIDHGVTIYLLRSDCSSLVQANKAYQNHSQRHIVTRITGATTALVVVLSVPDRFQIFT